MAFRSTGTGAVSEQSTVYWDLSKAEEDTAQNCHNHAQSAASAAAPPGGKFKISLQTIHQKQEMHSSAGGGTGGASTAAAGAAPSVNASVHGSPKQAPKYSVTTRMVRRTSTESVTSANGTNVVTEVTEYSLPAPATPPVDGPASPPVAPPVSVTSSTTGTSTAVTSPPVSRTTTFKFTSSSKSVPNLSVTLSQAVPVLRENIVRLRSASGGGAGGASVVEQQATLGAMLEMIEAAWATPHIGRDLAYGLCDVLRDDGGLAILIENCDVTATHEIQLSSARVLEQSLTVRNRDALASSKGLEIVVRFAQRARDDVEMTKAATGILENLFKHSEQTCSSLIQSGGLDSLLYSIRTSDTVTLRHCAVALANLAIYGGDDNQSEMVSHKAAEWLFPLAFSSDVSTRYYAFLAIAALSANQELEAAVLQSGTLELLEPFISAHDPLRFASTDRAHLQGQSSEWLRRLVPLLSSRRAEAQSLAAFHFAMEASVKRGQGHSQVVRTHTLLLYTTSY